VKRDGWGDKLHELIKSNTHHVAISVRIPYNLAIPQICRYNQRIAMLRAKVKKEGKDPQIVVPTITMEPYLRGVEGFQPLHQPPWFMTPSPTGQGRCFTNIHNDHVYAQAGISM
jgi:hypothetical protein